MKKFVWVILVSLFTIATSVLVVVQYVQMRRTVTVSDNLFNISVNNAMDDVIEQLNRLKVEDYIGQNDRYKLLKFKRIEELNSRMQDVVKENYALFYDTNIVQLSVTMIDSILLLPGVHVSATDSSAIARYNTLLATRDRLASAPDFYDQFVNDISEYVVDNIITSSSFNYHMLDSLITEKLVINGVDIAPHIGIYDYTRDQFIYCNADNQKQKLRETPYKYRFHPDGMMSPNEYFIMLHFPLSSLLLKENSALYFIFSFLLIGLIIILFLLSVRTILKQDKLDVMKNDFISNMTHEIKTPIATIGLACEMLSDPTISADPANNTTYIRIISDENKRMRNLVETILQSSKMSSDNYTLERKEIDVNNIIQSVVNSFHLQVQRRGGTIQCSLQASPSTIIANELHITNLVYNLIDNAIKYSPDVPEVTIATKRANDMLELTVADKGKGIDKEAQKHIFEKFYRVSTGDVHNVKGFGIGLSYVQQVVRLHGGTIKVDSTPGKGSTFTVCLPC